MDLSRSSSGLRWLIASGSVLVMVALAAGIWLVVLPVGVTPKFFDLESYRATLNAVANGALMFDWLGYPPVTLILLSPLRGLPELAGDQLWTGASMLMVLGLAAALTRLALTARDAPAERNHTNFLTGFGLVGALLLLSQPVSSNLGFGQVSLTIATLAFLDASGCLPRKWQGTLVGLAAALKLTPLIFIPYYLFTRQWRQAGVATASFAVATGIGFALFPRDSLYFWTHTDSSGRLGVDKPDNLSVLGLLSRWIADPALAKTLWYGVALAIGLAAFWRAWQHVRRNEHVEAALVIGCASAVISPIAWPHYQIWVVLAASWLLLTGSRRTMLIGALIYLPYFTLIFVPMYGAIPENKDYTQAFVPRVLWELAVVVPTLISVLGMPHRVSMAAEVPRDSHLEKPTVAGAPPDDAKLPPSTRLGGRFGSVTRADKGTRWT